METWLIYPEHNGKEMVPLKNARITPVSCDELNQTDR